MNEDQDLAQMLLTHDADEAVPPEHERSIREGLGALLGAPGAAPAPPAPAPAPPAAPRPPAGGAAQVAASSAAGKWVLLGLVAAGAAGGGFVVGRSTAPAPAPRAELVSPPAAPSSGPSASSAPTPAPDAAPTPLPAASTPTPTPTPPLPPATTPNPRLASSADVAGDAFDREQSLLERARSALVRHDAPAAELALQESERLFPRSPHAEERDYLRIQVFRERGEEAKAREHARAFVARYPQSLLRGRVEPLAR